MNWKAFGGFLALLVVLVAAMGLLMLVRRPNEMVFFVTGDTQGLLVPCGCRTVPAGGLARRASALALIRDHERGRQVVSLELPQAYADRGPARETVNRAFGAFLFGQHTLVGLGGYDLTLGPEALRTAAPGVPFYLAGREAFRGSESFRLGGWGVGPFGSRGASLRVVFLAESVPGGTPLGDPVEAFKTERSLHPADAFIAVGQISPPTVKDLLKVEPKLIAVVAQWGTVVTSLPQRAGASWVLFIGDRGRRGTVLRVASTPSGWTVLPEIAYLGPEVPSDAAVEAEVKGVVEEADRINADALARARRPPEPGRAYLGSDACRPCHAAEWDLWSRTRHAEATKDLAIDHQQNNPDCLVCHATGVGKPGGLPQAAVDLSGVGCESCHGPGEGHPGRRLGPASLEASLCTGCHGPRDSRGFVLDGYWEMIKH